MIKTIMIGLVLLTACVCSAQQPVGYSSLDKGNPIVFNGKYIVYKGDTIQLGPKSFFIDGRLSEEQASKYPFVYNSVQKAAEHLTDGSEGTPMVLNIAPYVYWIDDPDDPAIRMPKNGLAPYALVIKCEWLRFYGLSDHAENVVLACNRGQTIGSQGNFTMFNISGQGTSSENITFGNYCNIDLVFPLKPDLNRVKRASAIVQAQLIFCNGDKIVARNTRFVSRLNLMPFMGGKRVLFDRCHFESTDDALCGTGVYLNCTLEFYGSKPFYATNGTGAVFLNCDMKSFTHGRQYFTKANGQLAIIDSRLTTEAGAYLGWRDVPPLEMRNYQYNVSQNGSNVMISKNDPQTTVDLTAKYLLDAYRFLYKGKVIYNTYNLLAGNDQWDPMGIKEIVREVEKAGGRKYSMIPTQLIVSPTRVSIETLKNDVLLTAKVNRFGNCSQLGEVIKWNIAPEFKPFVKLVVNEDGTSCKVIPGNNSDETKQVVVTANTPSGLEAASVVSVAPSMLEAPGFLTLPKISKSNDGKCRVNYKLDMKYPDLSLVTWYRCSDASGSNPVEVAVSRMNKPLLEYELSGGDIGFFLKVSVAPKHIRCLPGEAKSFVMNNSVTPKDVKASDKKLSTDFKNFSTKNQLEVKPGFWTLEPVEPFETRGSQLVSRDQDAWYYGEGSDGAANAMGLMQSQNARMLYTPVGIDFRDMRLEMTVAPFKTEGQGFSVANRYMDLFIKFDTKTRSGYALRLIRTTKYHDAIDFLFLKYEEGNVIEISKPVSTTCYRPDCHIVVEVKGSKLMAHADTKTEYFKVPGRPEVATEVNIEQEIEPGNFGGFGIQYAGGAASMIKSLKVEWK
ncbi:MAG: hypothetical protein WCK18_14315 [Prolixibacteraceae bacterium]